METHGKNAARLIDREDSALVVIDVQEKLLPAMHHHQAMLAAGVMVAGFARLIGLPVVVTEQEKLGPTVPPLASALPEFEPIMKIEFDSCLRPEFRDALAALGRKNVIVFGIESHVCVTQTVLSLLPDYNVHVVGDAVSSRTEGNREVAIGRMRDAGAVVTSAEMVIFELLKKAGTDEFRETLKMVK